MKWRISLIITHEWAPSLSPPSPFRDISDNNARDRKGKHPLPLLSRPKEIALHFKSPACLVLFGSSTLFREEALFAIQMLGAQGK